MVLSPNAVGFADPRIDKLTRQLASTRAEVMSLTARLYGLEKALDKAKPIHEKFLKKVRTEAKTSKKHIRA